MLQGLKQYLKVKTVLMSAASLLPFPFLISCPLELSGGYGIPTLNCWNAPLIHSLIKNEGDGYLRQFLSREGAS